MYVRIQIILVISLQLLSCKAEVRNRSRKEADDEIDEERIPGRVPYKVLEIPFKTNKMNRMWVRAQYRLPEEKLISIFNDFKILDREEILWKRLKAEGKDRYGVKEAQLRKQLLKIMCKYGVIGNCEEREFDANSTDQINKKLNKLWTNAKKCGFSEKELEALEEEFDDHLKKIDEYYKVLSDVKHADENKNCSNLKLENYFSQIKQEVISKKDHIEKIHMLTERHRTVNYSFDRLVRLTTKGPDLNYFLEPEAKDMWNTAINSDFTKQELATLRSGLLNYEWRLYRLRNLRTRKDLVYDTANAISELRDGIKKQWQIVEKLYLDLETKIKQKHIEL